MATRRYRGSWWERTGEDGPGRLLSMGDYAPAPQPGVGFLWYDDAAQAFLVSEDGGAPATIAGGGGGGGGTPRQEVVASEAVSGLDAALADQLNLSPSAAAAVALHLNGVLLRQGAGADYTISGQTITWLAASGTAPDLELADELIAVYES